MPNQIVVYLYDRDTNEFLFAEYADESPREVGVYLVPPYSTTVSPPKTDRHEKAIFNIDTQTWEIIGDASISRDYKLTELLRLALSMKPEELDSLMLYANKLKDNR